MYSLSSPPGHAFHFLKMTIAAKFVTLDLASIIHPTMLGTVILYHFRRSLINISGIPEAHCIGRSVNFACYLWPEIGAALRHAMLCSKIHGIWRSRPTTQLILLSYRVHHVPSTVFSVFTELLSSAHCLPKPNHRGICMKATPFQSINDQTDPGHSHTLPIPKDANNSVAVTY